MNSIIPAAKLPAVKKAFLRLFNTTDIDDIVLLTGGLSTSLVYKCVSKGKAYVMRLIMQTDPLHNSAYIFECAQIAAGTGIAPPVFYTDPEDGILITAFIPHTDLRAGYSSTDALLQDLAKTIKAVHAAPLFSKKIDLFNYIDTLIDQFKTSGILPGSTVTEMCSYYTLIKQHYHYSNADIVSCHNDLNRGNILFDGAKIWIIDWDAAFQNDRYVDLAIAASSFISDEAQGTVFLTAYFGDAVDKYVQARFFLMRQVCYLLHAITIFKLASTSYDTNGQMPDLRDVGKQINDGSLTLSSDEGKFLYANALFNEAVSNMSSSRFASAIDICSSLN